MGSDGTRVRIKPGPCDPLPDSLWELICSDYQFSADASPVEGPKERATDMALVLRIGELLVDKKRPQISKGSYDLVRDMVKSRRDFSIKELDAIAGGRERLRPYLQDLVVLGLLDFDGKYYRPNMGMLQNAVLIDYHSRYNSDISRRLGENC